MKPNATKENETVNTLAEMAEAALKNYEQIVRTGFRMQEEAGRCWGSMLDQSALAQDWQKRFGNFTTLANRFTPLAERRVEEVLDLIQKGSKTNAELVKKAVDAVQTPGLAESQAKWLDFWTSSMGAARCNAEAVTNINAKALDAWMDFVRKNSDATESRAAKG